MNITLNIEATSPMELQEAISGLAGIVGGAVVTQPKQEKTKRSTSGTNKPDKDPEPETGSNTTDETPDNVPENNEGTPDQGETEKVPTVVELRAKAQEKGTTPEGKKAIKALLDEFGSKSISDVPEEKRAAFLLKLEAL
ncbi:hypothetical protein [Desulfosporosinus hippei]|uniref:Uncharacterized protein n=1 Tax=Desulfosporosinus hippei DSM 8344 TaxID=1121419 RepID=A0A1G7UNU0_9FIRM|nr:hypothetical protein [Desulfosporosinus hippei]SDG48400.1 hypothetical protein SAMN05443529_103181 [Desulfosporosinus hippei DSM 8344]